MNSQRLAWAVATTGWIAAAVAISATFRVTTSGQSPVISRAAGDAKEVGRLKKQVVTLENETGALRAELDRMRSFLEMKKTADARAQASGEEQLSDGEKRARVSWALGRLQDLARKLPATDEATYKELKDAFMTLARSSLEDPEPFRKAFDEAADPTTKSLLLPHLMARDREGAPALLKEELKRTEDPDYRATLLDNLRVMTNVNQDPEAQKLFFSSLDENSPPRARRTAVEALAQVSSPEAQQTLLEVAAGDSDEANREAAIRHLAENPDTRSRILEMMAKEPNARLRTIGECTAKLAEAQPSE